MKVVEDLNATSVAKSVGGELSIVAIVREG